MKNRNFNCPVDVTISMIGGKYKSIILWQLTNQTLRFGELSRLVPDATSKMLTQQLRELEDDKLVQRKVYPVVPPKVEYSLSELGLSIRPILDTMYSWGSDYMENEGVEISCTMK